MAIGLGRMFGFHFPENFNLPYISRSITEFWRRWHMTLSGWFRDYVYIPLGGNRRHVYLNLAVVFLLTGIWHGAQWTFVFWGIYNGFFILLERWLKKHPVRGFRLPGKAASAAGLIYTLLVVNFGWVLFRAPSLHDAAAFVLQMLGIRQAVQPGFTVEWYLDPLTLTVMAVGLLFSSSLPSRCARWMQSHTSAAAMAWVQNIACLLLFLLCAMTVVSGSYNPFIYFQF